MSPSTSEIQLYFLFIFLFIGKLVIEQLGVRL